MDNWWAVCKWHSHDWLDSQWNPSEVMVGGTGELWSIHRGAAVDRAEMHLASLGMPGQTRQEGWLLGPVSLFWQEQAFSQPEQKPGEHRPASSCVLTSLPCGIPWQASVHSVALSHFHHQHFLLPFLLFQLLIFCPFSGHYSVRAFSFLWCTKFPLTACVCLSTCSIMVLERTIVESCSCHELNQATGKQPDPGISEQLPALHHCLGFAVHYVLDIESGSLGRWCWVWGFTVLAWDSLSVFQQACWTSLPSSFLLGCGSEQFLSWSSLLSQGAQGHGKWK